MPLHSTAHPKPIMKKNLLPLLVACGIAAVPSKTSADNLLLNGDFESEIDLEGWVQAFGNAGSGSSIETVEPLAGAKSLKMIRTTQNSLTQHLASTITAGTATLTFEFEASGTTSSTGNRILSFNTLGSVPGTINLRVTGAGVVETFGTPGGTPGTGAWSATTITGLGFGTTHTLTLVINGFGADASYDLSVAGQSHAGLTTFQNGPIASLSGIQFQSNNNYNTSTVLIDNVSLTAEVPVEPRVTSITKTGNIVTVEFTGAEGRTYGLNKSPLLQFTPANIVDTTEVTGGTGTLTDSNASESAAFYRVELE